MILQHSRDGHGVFGVFLCDDRQGPDLDAIVRGEVLQRALVVLCDLIGDEARHG